MRLGAQTRWLPFPRGASYWTGCPAALHAVVPPSTLTASTPAAVSVSAAVDERPPDAQITCTGPVSNAPGSKVARGRWSAPGT